MKLRRVCMPLRVLPLVLLAGAALAQPAPAPEPGLAVITAESLLADVAHLSSPQYDGRLSGSRGYVEAARWAAARFAALGLEPGGDAAADGKGWLQWFATEYNEITDSPRLETVDAEGVVTTCQPGADFTARGFSGSGELTAPVVFTGYGLSQPARGYDDFAGVDV